MPSSNPTYVCVSSDVNKPPSTPFSHVVWPTDTVSYSEKYLRVDCGGPTVPMNIITPVNIIFDTCAGDRVGC